MITKDGIYAALMRESRGESESLFIEAVMTLLDKYFADLGSRLKHNLTLYGFVEAKVVFLDRLIADNFATMYLTLAQRKGFVVDELRDGVEDTNVELFLARGLSQYSLDALDATLERTNQSEDEVMLGPDMGLNDEVKERYRSRNLLLEDLFRLQPSVILNPR